MDKYHQSWFEELAILRVGKDEGDTVKNKEDEDLDDEEKLHEARSMVDGVFNWGLWITEKKCNKFYLVLLSREIENMGFWTSRGY